MLKLDCLNASVQRFRPYRAGTRPQAAQNKSEGLPRQTFYFRYNKTSG